MTFRLATLADVDALHELVNSAYRTKGGWTTEADLLGGQRVDPDMLREIISSGSAAGTGAGQTIVMLKDGASRVVASLHLQRDGQEAHLGMVSVRVDAQNKGLGKRLIKHALEWMAANWSDVRAVVLTVIRQREEVVAWYQRQGFKLTGAREPFPYGQEKFGLPKRQDLEFVVMRRELSNTSSLSSS